MRIFITGGTGLVGTRLIERLRQRQDEVWLLTRRPTAAQVQFGSACRIVEGDPMQHGAWMDAVRDCDAVVNLAGENIFGRRWNAAFKDLLRDSRLRATQHVVEAMGRSGSAKVLVSASAIGYYGKLEDEPVTETAPPGSDLLAQLCADWEAAAQAAQAHGVRVVCVRVGVVLDRAGGALQQLVRPFKLFAGGPVGSGKQWVSWVHHADLVGIMLLALANAQAAGAINGTAPNPVTNKELARAMGRALHRPSFMPTPALALRVVLGEAAGIITAGQRVLSQKALALGYSFEFPTVELALTDLLK
jgi:uncharacterized protein (TIGR01777 family)